MGIINTTTTITGSPEAKLTAYTNAFGGYQFYFFDKPYFHLGFRFRAHLGYGNYNEYGNGTTLYSHALQYGTEAQFLWDFVNAGRKTIGVHLSTGGIEGGTHFKSMSAGFGARVKMETQTDFVYILSSGIHIYLNVNHQFFMTYKYRVPLLTIHHDTGVIDYANGHSHASRTGLESMTHSFNFSYSYKF